MRQETGRHSAGRHSAIDHRIENGEVRMEIGEMRQATRDKRLENGEVRLSGNKTQNSLRTTRNLQLATRYSKLATNYSFLALLLFMLVSCASEDRKLPYLGPTKEENGKVIQHTIPHFSFTNQNNETITQDTYKGKIYVADFFFTSCPTICPVMKKQMLRVYEKYKENPEVGILSHSIDPRHDSVQVLNKYAKNLGVEGKMWNFVTGEQSKIYEIGEKSYMVSAQEDSLEAGGFIHSGAFILVDKQRHIRGLYDGTKEVEVTKLLKDIDVLLKEK